MSDLPTIYTRISAVAPRHRALEDLASLRCATLLAQVQDLHDLLLMTIQMAKSQMTMEALEKAGSRAVNEGSCISSLSVWSYLTHLLLIAG